MGLFFSPARKQAGAAHTKRQSASLLCLILLMSLSACSSFDGAPKPVLSTKKTVKAARALTEDYAEAQIALIPQQDGQRAYRDKVISLHLAAADARYYSFRRHLSREIKGANFGMGTVTLGLTGAASIVSGGVATGLAAGATALTGVKTSLSKEVYFEQTLPALVAIMDAKRNQVLAKILVNVRDNGVDKYPLLQAFTDLRAYEGASSIETAIQAVTTAAGQEAQKQQGIVDNIRFVAPVPADGVADLRGALRDRVKQWEATNDTAHLGKAAAALGLDSSGTASDVAQRIMLYMMTLSDVAISNAAIAKIDTATRN